MLKEATGRLILAYFQLTKPIISASVALSALTGFLIFQGFFARGWLLTMAGVFLLSSGSAAINHLQEAKTDVLMERTNRRPIPSGMIKPFQALFFAIILIFLGASILLQLDTRLPFFLGLINMVWYNAIYTPLKRLTAFAAIPGAVVGAIPPIIGWTAAGGSITHHHAILLAFLFFIGQIPHFWLILLKNAGDYEKAGFPTLTQLFSPQQVANLTLVWIFATAMAAVMLVLFGIIRSAALSLVIFLITFFLLVSFRRWFNAKKYPDPHPAFISLNIFYLLVMIVMIADALTR
ncbi:MAG: protoheme IX farnesyltransferase [Bacteroidales bacterium]|nr:protoheme IX farnesyltransferase [Bacteroidales bacterium]